MNNFFQGLGVALVTPFTKTGEVDYPALIKLVEYQLNNGVDFLVILATTGESPCLNYDEKETITRKIVEIVKGRVPILKYCGGNNTMAVSKEIHNSNWTVIDGILSVCPYYNKPSQAGLYEHFRIISQSTPLPIVLYNVPGRTGVNLSAETTLRLSKDFDNIVAIKEASGKLSQIERIISDAPKGFKVLSGDDALTYSMIASGAVGVISVLGNALPKVFSQMVHYAIDGEYDKALSIHHKLGNLYSLLFVDGNPSGCKALLKELGMTEDSVRLPLLPASEETRLEMMNIVKNI